MEFDRAARSARTCALAISPSFSFSVRSVTVASSAPAGVCLPEERGTENAHWRQDADFQVEQISPEYRMTNLPGVQEWEERLAEVRASCVACVLPDG